MSELDVLVADQAGMVARRQLNEHGVDWARVRNEIAARRWVERTPRVLSTTTGVLSLEQREWLAVLHAGPRSMLANLSAAGRFGLTGWERPWVSVMVDDELSFEPVDGVDFFRSRRPFDLLRAPRPGIPVCQLEPAVLLWAGYAPTPALRSSWDACADDSESVSRTASDSEGTGRADCDTPTRNGIFPTEPRSSWRSKAPST